MTESKKKRVIYMSFTCKHGLMSLGTENSTITTVCYSLQTSCTFARLQHHSAIAILLKILETMFSKSNCSHLMSTTQTHTVSRCILLGNWFPFAAVVPLILYRHRVQTGQQGNLSLMLIQKLRFTGSQKG